MTRKSLPYVREIGIRIKESYSKLHQEEFRSFSYTHLQFITEIKQMVKRLASANSLNAYTTFQYWDINGSVKNNLVKPIFPLTQKTRELLL